MNYGNESFIVQTLSFLSWPKYDHDISISQSKTIMNKGSSILFLIFLLGFEIVARPVTITGERNEW